MFTLGLKMSHLHHFAYDERFPPKNGLLNFYVFIEL